ncbi:MAG TPA: type II secretion system F family protein [Bacillales bacterium]|nr:type II secretion system F family protein [Bacillales bacterium]
MKLLILLFVSFTSFLWVFAISRLFAPSDKRLTKRIQHYLELQDQKGFDRKRFSQLVTIQLFKQRLKGQIGNKRHNAKLEKMLSRSGIPLKPEEYVLFRWMAVLLGGGIFYLLAGNWILLITGAFAGWMMPKWWLKKKQRDRLTAFNEQLPDMLTTIIGSLRAGFSFSQALMTVIEEADPPMKDEIKTLLKEIQYGNSMESALGELKDRMPSEDLELMIQAILIQRQVGGNLAEVLDKIVQTIRDRNRIQRNILTLTAQGRLSGLIIGLMPVILGFVLYLIQPQYIGALFTNPIGIVMVAAGAVSCTVGFLMIRKLTKIEV